MNSIVLELQRAAMDKSRDVDDLLRLALVIATKLKLKKSVIWVNKELKGYISLKSVPAYRRIAGELKVHNPYNGIWMPVVWDGELPDFLRFGSVQQPISELQKIVSQDKKGLLSLTIPPDAASILMKHLNIPLVPSYIIQMTSIFGILEAVRNIALEWALKLEADGILGQGMAFTQNEQKTAMGTIYNITNFSGVIGDINGNNTQIGDYSDIHTDLKALGFSQTERNEIESLMEQTSLAKDSEKRNLVTKGIDWIVKHGDKLGSLSNAIRGWFEQQSS
jgi:hypothetical protein